MKCKTVSPFTMRYGEFPELLFANSVNGTLYFDATRYIELKGDSTKHSPVDFARKFSFWFETLQKHYDVPGGEMMATDEDTGHVLIDESLSLLFVAYIDPAFGAYMVERVTELLLNGIVLSDTRIIAMARDRISTDLLTNLIDENEKKSISST